MSKETGRPTAGCLEGIADLVVIRLTDKGPIACPDTTIKAAVADVIQRAGGGPLSNVGMVTIEEVLAGGRTFTSDDVAAVEAKVKALLGGQMSKENGRPTAAMNGIAAQAYALAIEAIDDGACDWEDADAVQIAVEAVIAAMSLEMVVSEVAARIRPLVARRIAAVREE
jgi:hypothetical protein